MCGITGVRHLDDRPVCPSVVERMTGVLAHRGPDDSGVRVDGPVGLGHRRLTVIDVSSAGRGPLSNEDGTVWVTYNGEIYNFEDLRTELTARGHRFASRTDTEVVVHAYEEWGEACLGRLNGMFAFGLWDAKTRTLLLARDRLGIKPLYYYADDRVLLFGSEIKAILQYPGIDRRLDAAALVDYFALNHVPAPATPFRRVRALPPGSTLSVTPGSVVVRPYWELDLPDPDDQASAAAHVQAVRDLVDDAVERQLVSDVPLGAFLSGGIDSTAVVEAAQRARGGPLETFSVRFAETSHDEGPYARLAASALGSVHHEVTSVAGDVPRLLDRIVWHADNLTADLSMVPMYVVAGLAREHVKVVLSGDGGDEVFGGYATYQADRAAAVLRRLPAAARAPVVRVLAGLMPRSEAKAGAGYLSERLLMAAGLPSHRAHASWRTIFDEEARAAVLRHDVLEAAAGHDPAGAFEACFAAAPASSLLGRLSYADLKTFLPDSILPKVDTMTMAHGLEARVPLLDHRLVELGARIPARLKLRGLSTKWIFKRAMASRLPAAIVKRRKEGFQPPLAAWLRAELESFTADLLARDTIRGLDILDEREVERIRLEHVAGRRDHAFKLWSLMNFVAWHRQGFTREPE